MFNFSHSLLISPFLLLLVPPVAICGVGGSISWGMGLKTLTSKSVLWNVPFQKLLAAISSRAPFWVLAEASLSISSVTGWSSGSIFTLWHTSVRRVAVMSLISLCLMDGNPPLAHEKACSTVSLLPQAQLDGRFEGGHPYRRARASWKAPL